jgi:hypothetical protein
VTGPGFDEGRLADLRAAIAGEPITDELSVGTARDLHRLCRSVVTVLPASGAAVSLMSEGRQLGIVAVDAAASAEIEELQFLLGEGPCWDAFDSRFHVLAPDLLAPGFTRWPGYSAGAVERGVLGAFAFPLQIGAALLGVLDIYRARTGPLSGEELANSLAFAEIATRTLLDGQEAAGEGATPRGVEDVLEPGVVVFQAQGMAMIQLGVSLIEAIARLRAYTYAMDRTLGDVARDIVGRRLVLEPDEGGGR